MAVAEGNLQTEPGLQASWHLPEALDNGSQALGEQASRWFRPARRTPSALESCGIFAEGAGHALKRPADLI